MNRQTRRQMVEGVQYGAFWLANEVHSLPPGRAFLALLGEISDEAIDLAVRCTTAGRQIVAVLTDALATKLHGDRVVNIASNGLKRSGLIPRFCW